MLKLIIGVRGTGKTKQLISLVNAASTSSNGSVICIERGSKLNYDITYKARLVDTKAFAITDAGSLYGFIAGMSASNHDITDLFVDSALKICNNDMAAFTEFVTKVDKLSAEMNFNVVMTVSAAPDDCSPEVLAFAEK